MSQKSKIFLLICLFIGIAFVIHLISGSSAQITIADTPPTPPPADYSRLYFLQGDIYSACGNSWVNNIGTDPNFAGFVPGTKIENWNNNESGHEEAVVAVYLKSIKIDQREVFLNYDQNQPLTNINPVTFTNSKGEIVQEENPKYWQDLVSSRFIGITPIQKVKVTADWVSLDTRNWYWKYNTSCNSE